MQTKKRRRVRRIALFAGALAVAPAVIAVTPPRAAAQGPSSLRSSVSLAELYEHVTRGNPRTTAAQALVRAAQARVSGAKRPPDPQIQLGLMNYSLPGLSPMQPIGMAQLQAMQMVPLGGKLALAGRVAGAQADAMSARADDVAWELRNETAMAFYDLYATDRQLAVVRETLRLLEDIARTAESMYRVGEGRQTDVLRANVEIAEMAEDTVRMRAMRATMVSRINALLNRDAGESLESLVRPTFPDSVPARGWLDSVAAGARPTIRAGMQQVRAASSSAALARKEIIPDLQIGVQYGQRGATMTDADGMTSRRTERMGSLMIGASVPLFARDRQLQMRNEADAMKAMAQAELDAMRAETRGAIGEAYAVLTRARDLARLFRTTILPQAEATVASALSSYRVGNVDFMTLLDDQMAVNRYRQSLIELEADEGKAWAQLERLTGRDLIDSSSTAISADSAGSNVGAQRGGQ
jgi:outer membrane protein TolC